MKPIVLIAAVIVGVLLQIHAPAEQRPVSRAHARSSATRDSHGRIARSEKARQDFKRQTGYSSGRPGYIIDHVVPLECGGADAPSNMQWQSRSEAKIKDRTERECRR